MRQNWPVMDCKTRKLSEHIWQSAKEVVTSSRPLYHIEFHKMRLGLKTKLRLDFCADF